MPTLTTSTLIPKPGSLMAAIKNVVTLTTIIRTYTPETTLWSVSVGGEQSRHLVMQSRTADAGVVLEAELAMVGDAAFGAYLEGVQRDGSPFAANLHTTTGPFVVEPDGPFVNTTAVPRVAVISLFDATPEAIAAMPAAQQAVARHGGTSSAALMAVNGVGPDLLCATAIYSGPRAFATGVAGLRADAEFTAVGNHLRKVGRMVAMEVMF